MDHADRELFERSLRHATQSCTGDELDVALDDVGWTEALAADPQVAVSLLFELQGAANVTSSSLGRLVATTLGIDNTASAAGVVLPALGGWSPPGRYAGERLTVRGLATSDLLDRQTALVATRRDHNDVVVVVSLDQLSRRPVSGIDPSLGLVEVTGDAVATTSWPAHWSAAVARSQLALGHELVGAARTMLDLAREHALERIQFGRPIATFQAVRHRLADTLVAIETADAALGAAWEDESPQSATMAKALAGRAARTTARHCQQVLAGIGFTTEHALHRYVRRVLVLDELFGSARALTHELGNDVLHNRRLPTLLPL
ncbi:MAG: acyl-CoA dehydrogenase family protein [Acidimicrobiales bacterium]